MNFRRTILAATGAIVVAIAVAVTGLQPAVASSDGFDSGQKKAIETIIHDYLLANPEVLIQSMQEYTQRQETSKRNSTKDKLAGLSDILKRNPGTPVGGNPKGDISVIEFFDYRCPYCKKVSPTVMKLLKDDGNIRYVLKEFPILGPMSVFATRVSLAIWAVDPGKYMAYHKLIMASRGQLDKSRIMKYAKKAGLDMTAVRGRMKDPAIDKEIMANSILGRELGITGTPTFIIGQHIVPGAVDMETLKQLVKAARGMNAKDSGKAQ